MDEWAEQVTLIIEFSRAYEKQDQNLYAAASNEIKFKDVIKFKYDRKIPPFLPCIILKWISHCWSAVQPIGSKIS